MAADQMPAIAVTTVSARSAPRVTQAGEPPAMWDTATCQVVRAGRHQNADHEQRDAQDQILAPLRVKVARRLAGRRYGVGRPEHVRVEIRVAEIDEPEPGFEDRAHSDQSHHHADDDQHSGVEGGCAGERERLAATAPSCETDDGPDDQPDDGDRDQEHQETQGDYVPASSLAFTFAMAPS